MRVGTVDLQDHIKPCWPGRRAAPAAGGILGAVANQHLGDGRRSGVVKRLVIRIT
jgi:hypothetical protein